MNNECFDYFDKAGVNLSPEWGCGTPTLDRMAGHINGDRKKNTDWSHYVQISWHSEKHGIINGFEGAIQLK